MSRDIMKKSVGKQKKAEKQHRDGNRPASMSGRKTRKGKAGRKSKQGAKQFPLNIKKPALCPVFSSV